jgi:hypothetical protein
MENKFTRLYSQEEKERNREEMPTKRHGRDYFQNDRQSMELMEPEYERRERRERRESREDRNPRKWTFVVDMPRFRPEETKVKVDTVFHTLIITAKRVSQPWQGEQEKCMKMKRVIPLPESIRLEELRVKFTPRGELIVKAPYHRRSDEMTMPLQRHQRGGEITLPVFYKDVTGKRRQEELLPSGQVDTNKCSVQRYLRLLKNSSFPNTLSTECVRDENTGKWKIIFEINTVGFRREEVQVHFQEKERLLIVEAKHELRTEKNQLPGISVKTLRREFILPEFLDGKQMRYRVMNTGVLRIQLPCLRDPRPKMCNEEEDMEEEMFFRFKKADQQTKME